MTNEEIEKSAKEIANELVRYCDRTPDDEAFVAERLRSLVAKAYEEAAQVAEKSYNVDLGGPELELPDAVANIRALKESLVVETSRAEV